MDDLCVDNILVDTRYNTPKTRGLKRITKVLPKFKKVLCESLGLGDLVVQFIYNYTKTHTHKSAFADRQPLVRFYFNYRRAEYQQGRQLQALP